MADENNDFAQDADGQQSSQAPNINLECDFLSLNLAQLREQLYAIIGYTGCNWFRSGEGEDRAEEPATPE
jgi:hypothetical protein